MTYKEQPMSTGTSSELLQFHQFVAQKLATNDQALSPEEALEQWREEHPSPEETEQTVAAVMKALQAMRAGEKGVPAREFLARLRAEHDNA
jgi:ferric-dicitrate binding protein FerR (iron transport regulator)